MKRWIVLIALIGLSSSQAAAQDAPASDVPDTQPREIFTLEKVEVEDEREESGKTVIDSETLKILPSRSGSITEALKGQSNVQFDLESNSNLTGGEIRPPRISISGGRPYENNFLIDGTSITNDINPGGVNNNEPDKTDTLAPGADQMMFFNTDMLESIEVYSSNIPAKYGSFLGGVVDAELRKPKRDTWHFSTSGRYTQDEWADTDGLDKDSEDPTEQPEYTKYDAAFRAEGPIGDKVAMLASYSRIHSTIPLKRKTDNGTTDLADDFFVEDEQERTNENYFLRFQIDPTADLGITLDGAYTPYSETRWLKNFTNSGTDTVGDAYRVSGTFDYHMDAGNIEGKLVYAETGYSRDSQSNHQQNHTNKITGEKNAYGAFGDSEMDNRVADAGLDFSSRDWALGKTGNLRFETGVNYNYTTTEIWNEAVTTTQEAINTWGGGNGALTEMELPEHEQTNSLARAGAYLQGDLQWRNLNLRPGFRLDYDNFTDHADIAPRVRAEYDLFGSGAARLVGGLNRYYGGQLRNLAFDLKRPLHTTIAYDNNLDGIYGGAGDNASLVLPMSDIDYNMDELETPYSDEWVVGVNGEWAGFTYGIEYVNRDNKKQLIREKEETAPGENASYRMTNNGSSAYRGLTFTVSRPVQTDKFGNHDFSIGVTDSETETFNGAYDSVFNDNASTWAPGGNVNRNLNEVYYNGTLTAISDLPAENYNAPVVVTLNWDGRFLEDRLRLHTTTRWQDESSGLKADEREPDDTPFGLVSPYSKDRWLDGTGTWAYAYTEGDIDGGWNTDITVEFDFVKRDMFTFTGIVEVANLFNDSMETSVSDDSGTTIGRSFYVGMRAEF